MLADPSMTIAFCDYHVMGPDGTVDRGATDRNSRREGRTGLAEGRHAGDAVRLALVDQSIQISYAAVFRRTLDLDAVPAELAPLHDLWIAYLGTVDGGPVWYCGQRLTRYRHHGGSATASSPFHPQEAASYACFLADPRLASLAPQLRRKKARAELRAGLSSLLDADDVRSGRRQVLTSLRTAPTALSVGTLLATALPGGRSALRIARDVQHRRSLTVTAAAAGAGGPASRRTNMQRRTTRSLHGSSDLCRPAEVQCSGASELLHLPSCQCRVVSRWLRDCCCPAADLADCAAAVIRGGESVRSGEQLVADVCIIGSGPAGLTVATELLGSGLRVLVVEAGRRRVLVGGESYGSGRSVGERYPLERSRARGLGGTANRWDIETPAGGPSVRLRELEELDFEDRPAVRTLGWPFGRAELDPHYRRAREIFELQPVAPQDDAPLGEGVSERLFSFGPSRVFTTALPSRLDAAADVTVLCDAAIGELHLDDTGRRVESLVGRTRSGTPFTVLAGACVLAGGGIENARLLLASRAASPRGVGNDHDQVGRWFLEHPHVMSGVAVPYGPGLLRRREAWDLFLKGEHPVQRKYGLTAEVQRREGLLDVAYLLDPRAATAVLPLSSTGDRDADALSAVRHVLRMVRQRRWSPGPAQDPGLVLQAAPRMAAYAVRQRAALRAAHAGRPSRHRIVFTLVAMAEQRPLPSSRVRLGRGVDAFGMPEAELDWRVDLADAQSLHRSQELVAPALSRALDARVTSLVKPDELPGLGVGYHHMGTTRMSLRPETGVVDRDCRVHGVPNLFVAGSSVFPTSGSANPTLTVVALSARLGQLLRRELRPSVALAPSG